MRTVRRCKIAVPAILIALAMALSPQVGKAVGDPTYFAQSQNPSVPVIRPRVLQVAGEGSFAVQKMRWAVWNRRVARGRGIGAQDDCIPGCSDGTFHRAPAQVRLWRPRSRCGNRVWTRMTLTWVHGAPKIAGEQPQRRVVWKLALFPCE